MAEYNDLDELRALWRDVRPPAEPAAMDAETKRAVDWMRAAWRTVEPPAVPLPPPSTAQRTGAAPAVLAVLAAAALLLAVMRLVAGDDRRRPAPNGVTACNDGAEVSEHPGDEDVPGSHVEASPLVAIAPDRIEMRRGCVRLILLRQVEAADDPDPGEPR